MRRLLGLAAIAVTVLALADAAERVVPGRYAISDSLPDALTGLALVACGLVAAGVTAYRGTGGLLVASGLTWFIPNFAYVAPGWLATAAGNALFLHRALLLHAVVAYPTGRTRDPLGLAAIAAVYAAAFAPQVWQHDAGAAAVTTLVVMATAMRVRRTAGPRRRQRLVALGAAVVFAAWIAASIIARHTIGPDRSLLTAYELDIVAIALLLTLPLLVHADSQADVADLVVELRGSRTPALRDRLARALGDPSLQVGYWVPDQDAYVDTAGRPVDVTDRAQRGVTAVSMDGSPVAVILHDPAVLDDPQLLQAVTSATRLGGEHARLQAETRARLVEAEQSRRRIVDAAGEARRRLERRLTGGVLRRLEELDRGLLGADDQAAVTAVREQIARARVDLVRLAGGIHPAIASDRALAEALRELVSGMLVAVDLDVDPNVDGVPAGVAACIWFVCAESLANAVKYAAASHVTVQVQPVGARVMVRIGDDGVGGADPLRGSGLRGLADRVAAFGGTLSVDSPVGRGTTVTADLPTAIGS